MEPYPASAPAAPTQAPFDSPLLPPREHLQSSYAEAFRCIGSACEDTCCRGWSVPIDQATYERYRTHQILKPFVGKLIVLNTNSPSTTDYARMPLTMNGQCGFLDEERLCSIQRNLGPEMLSATCATYPRAIQIRGGVTGSALNLSCPEAARLVLLDPALLVNGRLSPDLPRPNSRNSAAVASGRGQISWSQTSPDYASFAPSDGALPAAGEIRLVIRDFVLTLLSDRRYPIWQRLYLLGPTVRRLQTLAGANPLAAWCEANPAIVLHILAHSANNAAGLRLKPTMDELKAQPADQLQLVAEILRLRLAEPPTPPRFIECIQDFERGLHIVSARSEQEILSAYAVGQHFFDALLETHPQLIENYLLNHVFKNSFPFGRLRLRANAEPAHPFNPEEEYTLLCVLATLAQTLLIGMAAYHREAFGVDHVVKLIQSMAKTIEHGTTFPARLAEYVQQRGLDAILVKTARPAKAPPALTRLPLLPVCPPHRHPSPLLPVHL